MNVLSLLLAVITVIILVGSNVRRVRYIWFFLRAQPGVHKLLPHAFRNTQIAWLCNFQASAVVLESTSLSEYIIDNGGPVVAGKQKELLYKPRVIVESITRSLLADKLKYQDLPMLLILVVHLLATMGSEKSADQKVSLAYIGVTLTSLVSGYTSYRWPRLNKEVDLKSVVNGIQDRLQECQNRKEENAKAI